MLLWRRSRAVESAARGFLFPLKEAGEIFNHSYVLEEGDSIYIHGFALREICAVGDDCPGIRMPRGRATVAGSRVCRSCLRS